jgi:hypothetical protein
VQILVALATTRNADAIGRLAIEEAVREHDGVTLLMVTEKAEIERVYQLRSDPVLQGTRTLDDILREIELEHRRMLEEHAMHIEARAQEAGVEVEKRLAVGDYLGEVILEAAKRPYRCVYWLRHSRGFIARFFLGSDEDQVIRSEVGSDVRVVLDQDE